MRSFDLFDTLIARRCGNGDAVFAEIETRSRIHGFADARRCAERALYNTEYDLDAIYATLRTLLNFTPEQTAMLRALELAVEWDVIYPIAETVSQVSPDDIIVTDMYLPDGFIRRIVEEKCDLTVHAIYRTSAGKYHGTIWPNLLKTHPLSEHIGDHLHSDIASPQACNIATRHITIARDSAAEGILREIGLDNEADLVRETRLRSFHEDPDLRHAQHLQLAVNIPFMLMASHDILAQCAAREIDRLLLCARDSSYLQYIFPIIAEQNSSQIAHRLNSRYFRASRLLFLTGSPDYLSYFHHERGQRTMLVDVCGTGGTMARFIEKTGTIADSVGYIVYRGGMSSYWHGSLFTRPTDVDIRHFILGNFATQYVFEAMNTPLEASTESIECHNGSFVAQPKPEDFDSSYPNQARISAMRKIVESFAALAIEYFASRTYTAKNMIRAATRAQAASPTQETLRQAAEAIIRLVDPFTDLIEELAEPIKSREGAVYNQLRDAIITMPRAAVVHRDRSQQISPHP